MDAHGSIATSDSRYGYRMDHHDDVEQHDENQGDTEMDRGLAP